MISCWPWSQIPLCFWRLQISHSLSIFGETPNRSLNGQTTGAPSILMLSNPSWKTHIRALSAIFHHLSIQHISGTQNSEANWLSKQGCNSVSDHRIFSTSSSLGCWQRKASFLFKMNNPLTGILCLPCFPLVPLFSSGFCSFCPSAVFSSAYFVAAKSHVQIFLAPGKSRFVNSNEQPHTYLPYIYTLL